MKRLLSVVLTLTLCMGLSAPALAARTFTDVPSTYWAYDAIQYVVDEGLFSGTTSTTFSPGRSMTRTMLWVVLARMDGVDTSADQRRCMVSPVWTGPWRPGSATALTPTGQHHPAPSSRPCCTATQSMPELIRA